MKQLVSGQGAVSDGLILRITTEGLFIDDDRREVAQRDWDVKAWTLKLAEVWCPNLFPESKSPRKASSPLQRADTRQPDDGESNAFAMNHIRHCNGSCGSSKFRSSVSSVDKDMNNETKKKTKLTRPHRAAKWVASIFFDRPFATKKARDMSLSSPRAKGGRLQLACND